ncbi:MAG TPA: PLP-dependent aminotransferase family protein [Gammaproteobacteria bacterium]|nr:PLP-dependent aminotransferase family protein [Gammaproteobacteria bacterium]
MNAPSPPRFLYQRIARDMRQAIGSGVYPPGQRLPSVRQLARQYRVSLSTAILAYRNLEAAGWLEARPKSGHFARAAPRPPRAPEPAPTASATAPRDVSVGALAMALVDETRAGELTRLGAAVPEADLLPLSALARHLAGTARRRWQAPASYEATRGNPLLRAQIARLMRDAGCNVLPEEVLVTNGCMEALSLALLAVARPGETVAVESPTYFGVLQVIEALGMRALEIATHPRTGIEPDALEQALAGHNIRACVLMPGFHNPLGACMPAAHKRRVVALLAARGVPLIEDDVYGALSFASPRPPAAKAFDEDANIIYCASFSKTIAPAYRIGWAVPGRHLERMVYLKFLRNLSTATPTQLALADFLADGGFQRHLRRAVPRYRQRLEQIYHAIDRHFPPGTRYTQPEGGFLLWLELPASVDSVQLHREALSDNIAVTPGLIFSPAGQYRHHLRLSVGACAGEILHRAVASLGRRARQAAD